VQLCRKTFLLERIQLSRAAILGYTAYCPSYSSKLIQTGLNQFQIAKASR